MSLYYILLDDEYQGEKFEIGNIMQLVSNKLYESTKLKLWSYMGPTSEEIEQYFLQQDMEPISEEIVWKKMTDEMIIKKFLQYIEQIEGIKGDLLIIDPYLFCKKASAEYKIMLQAILAESNYSSLMVITDKAHFDDTFFEETKKALGKEIQIIFSEEFHDRFWIANECCGFIAGTSLNGIGKKYSSINIMDKDDVINIVKIIKSLQ